MTGSAPAIRADGLTRDFGAVRALDSLALEVPRGVIFGFLGPNGAGKTTTIGLLLGLLEPTAGSAEVLGLDPWRMGDEVRRQAGAVLHDTGVYDFLTAEENLEFRGRAARLPDGDRRGRIRGLLEAAGLWERRHEKAGTWSRGMQQRLALAGALLHRPSIVFLDEPTAGLDVIAAAAVRDELAALPAREGATVFLTTHNLAEAERLCHLVAVVRAGRLVAIGSPADLRRRTGEPRVEVAGRGFDDRMLAALRGRPGVVDVARVDGRLDIRLAEDADRAPLVGLLVGLGAQVDEVRPGQASLEDVFLTLMGEDR